MLRYGSRGATVTTTTDSLDQPSERRIRRLRLTLHTKGTTDAGERIGSVLKRQNGSILSGRPVGAELPVQPSVLSDDDKPQSTPQGPTVYGVVQRAGPDSQQEVTARQWYLGNLRDEMNYIREVRDSLEKVRRRMFGQFDGMQQSMQNLSQNLRIANYRRRSLEAQVRVHTSAMNHFDQMNSSLISSNIDLQKSLLEKCEDRIETRTEVKKVHSSCQQTEEQLRETEKQLTTARTENHTLRLQVESSKEANSQALKEITEKLRNQQEARLQEQQRRHKEQVEALQAQVKECERRVEVAERSARVAEERMAEKDERVREVARLLSCMEQEKSQLLQKLQDCEERQHSLGQTEQAEAAIIRRSQQLEEEAVELRERITHLDNMVLSQQRKVKGLIKEVETLRAKVTQKDQFIAELLDRIAIVECENNELEDKLKYFVSMLNKTGDDVLSRGTLRSEVPLQDHVPHALLNGNPTTSSFLSYSSHQDRSLLMSGSAQLNPIQAAPASRCSDPSSPLQASTRPRSQPSRIYTPYMRLMEITAAIKIE